MLIGVIPTMLKADDASSFWEMARSVKADILAASGREAIQHGLAYASGAAAAEGDPHDVSTIDPRNVLAHDLMVSNYGSPAVRTDYGSLQLRELFPSVNDGRFAATQSVSVITVGGTMCLTQQSPSLLNGLLGAALDHLRHEARA